MGTKCSKAQPLSVEDELRTMSYQRTQSEKEMKSGGEIDSQYKSH